LAITHSLLTLKSDEFKKPSQTSPLRLKSGGL
jgi:hypothetical protein